MIRRTGGKANGDKEICGKRDGSAPGKPLRAGCDTETQSIVHFLAQFKALFYEGLQAGKAPVEIVMEYGIDPDILGVNRVNGLKNMVFKEAKAGKGFRDLNTYGTYLEHLLTPEAKIRFLEEELTYKDQVIEYLKKIVSSGQAGAE